MTITEEFFRPKSETDIPYIYAKKILPMEYTYNFYDKSWEGLRKVNRKGVITFEIDMNQAVEINGATGECKIPDTENNRKRLEKLSHARKSEGTHLVLQEDGVTMKEETIIVEAPPAFKRLDENVIEKSIMDELEAKMMERFRDRYDIIPKQHPTVEEPDLTPIKGTKVKAELLDPIK